MRKLQIIAVLGVLLILAHFLGFPLSWIKIFSVVCGVAIVVLSFWSLSEAKHKNAGE
ncbi:MAG: hypothetical protein Q8P07_04190 [bacterium]|nr:hypothetical protein [bacterium]